MPPRPSGSARLEPKSVPRQASGVAKSMVRQGRGVCSEEPPTSVCTKPQTVTTGASAGSITALGVEKASYDMRMTGAGVVAVARRPAV